MTVALDGGACVKPVKAPADGPEPTIEKVRSSPVELLPVRVMSRGAVPFVSTFCVSAAETVGKGATRLSKRLAKLIVASTPTEKSRARKRPVAVTFLSKSIVPLGATMLASMMASTSMSAAAGVDFGSSGSRLVPPMLMRMLLALAVVGLGL